MKTNRGLLPNLLPCIPEHVLAKVPTAILAVLFVLTLPIYCVAAWFLFTFRSCLDPIIKSYECKWEKARKEAAMRKAITTHTPQILGPRLGKSLTIGRPTNDLPTSTSPSESSANSSSTTVGAPKSVWKITTDNQGQSHLFKLPIELRTQIWKEVISDYTFHIFFTESYLPMRHSRCKADADDTKKRCTCPVLAHEWKAYQPRGRKQPGAVDQWGNGDLLSLSKTCRRMYSETMEMLYSTNTFEFNSLIEVLRFSLTVLPERMSLMRSVRWKWTGIYDGVNPNYMAHSRFAYPRIGKGEDRYCTKMPWLECRRIGSADDDGGEEGCRCMSCWKREGTIAVEEQQDVVYWWIVRLADGERERKKVEVESSRASEVGSDEEEGES